MKLGTKVFCLVFGGILGGGLVSCTNELNDFQNNQNLNKVNLVKTPEVVAWSGAQKLEPGQSVGTRANNYPSFFAYCTTGHTGNKNDWAYVWTPNGTFDLSMYYDNLPTQTGRGQGGYATTQAEADYVFQWLEENSDKGSNANNISDYFIQVVGANNKKYSWNGNEESNYTMNSLILNSRYSDPYNPSSSEFGNSYNGNGTGSVQGELVLCLNYPIENPSYTHTNGGREYNAYRFYYITLPEDIDSEDAGKTCLYLGFDFRATSMNFSGNGKFYDWVMKLIPADGSEIQTPTPTPDPDPDPDPVVPEEPAEDPVHHDSEVEVNYEILDSHEFGGEHGYAFADLITKLSIHVRHATDVAIRIPVPVSYVIESDDLYIFNEHYVDGNSYGGNGLEFGNGSTSQSHTYNIGGKDVTLKVSFYYEYIEVTTEGIDEAIIAYCEENYGDGVNFEVYNYYQTEKRVNDEVIGTGLIREVLKECLDGSTITFLDSNPDYYINAFGWDYVDDTNGEQHNDIINPDDCHVRPTSSSYNSPVRGWHLNGTPFNDIYILSGVEADSGHPASSNPDAGADTE